VKTYVIHTAAAEMRSQPDYKAVATNYDHSVNKKDKHACACALKSAHKQSVKFSKAKEDTKEWPVRSPSPFEHGLNARQLPMEEPPKWIQAMLDRGVVELDILRNLPDTQVLSSCCSKHEQNLSVHIADTAEHYLEAMACVSIGSRLPVGMSTTL